MSFKITKFPNAEAQLRALAKRATALGVFQSFADTIERIKEHLENEPLQWGDPEYNLKHAGGVACHGIEGSLLVRFAVYETEKTVFFLGIDPLPDSPLAGV